MKNTFINNEIWNLTFGGGFQRSNAYQKSDTSKEVERKDFRNALRAYIENIVYNHYVKNTVSSKEHLKHITSIINFTKEYGSKNKGLLTNNQLNFGIVQKVLNLYLKYQWCLGKVQTPPHFPVDRIIQELLIKEIKKSGLELFELKPWTQFKDSKEYLMVIDAAEKVMKKKKIKSLAELEIDLFDRR